MGLQRFFNDPACQFVWPRRGQPLQEARTRFTVTGGPRESNSPYGKALFLDGDTINVGNIRTLRAESYVFWIRVLDEACGILALNGIGDWVGVTTFPNAVMFSREADNNRVWTTPDITVAPNNGWHTIIITIPGAAQADIASANAYLDGVPLVVALTNAAGAPTAYSSFIIGQNLLGDLDGYLAGIVVMNRVLSPAECLQIAGGGT